LDLADTLETLIAVGELEEAERKLEPWERPPWALDRSWALAITARRRALVLATRGDLVGAACGSRAARRDGRIVTSASPSTSHEDDL
jgi:hypothetical protein